MLPITGDRLSCRGGVAAAAAALAAGALTLNHDLVGVFYDDGVYAGIALALARGLGFIHPHLPGTPAVVHYPPLYPLMLAPLFGAFPVPVAHGTGTAPGGVSTTRAQ